MMSPESNRIPRRPRLHLPFEKRHSDLGEWAYEHRVGLCVTLVAYLVLAICFVTGRIVLDTRPHSETIYVDLQSLAELEAERDRLEEEVKRRQSDNIDWQRIQNLVSNENAAAGNEGSRGVAEPNSEAARELEARMRANREAYERGLAEEQAILHGNHSAAAESSRPSDQRVSGPVTVRLDVKNPVRTGSYLEIPAYMCEGGGEVVVEITVNRAGEVVAARVRSGGDAAMRDAALQAAQASRVNINSDAPARQTGTITYIFIPQ